MAQPVQPVRGWMCSRDGLCACVWTTGRGSEWSARTRGWKPAPVTASKEATEQKQRCSREQRSGETDKEKEGERKIKTRDEEDGYSRDGLVCPPVFASISVLCALWITTTWSRRNFIMVAAFGCSLKDWSIWLRHSPAMLPMTPQNIQLLGSTEGAGGHQKKRIVALRKKKRKKDRSPVNELIFCPLAPSHLHWHKAVLWCILQHSKNIH